MPGELPKDMGSLLVPMSGELPTDVQLLATAVLNAGRDSVERKPRWAHVKRLLVVGSTTAHEVCRRFRVDPDEMLGGGDPVCDECGDEIDEWGGYCDGCADDALNVQLAGEGSTDG